jgi:hypothetical protein
MKILKHPTTQVATETREPVISRRAFAQGVMASGMVLAITPNTINNVIAMDAPESLGAGWQRSPSNELERVILDQFGIYKKQNTHNADELNHPVEDTRFHANLRQRIVAGA